MTINENNVLLIDVDDCIADFMGSCLRLAADKFNIFAKPEDCTKDPYWDALGCPTLEAVIDHEILHREFCYQIKPISAGIQFLRELESLYGTDNVLICTSPWKFDSRETATGEWASQRYAWLRDVAKVPRDRVIMAKRKRHVQGILIDDSVKNLEQRRPGQGYCIAQPYNTQWQGPRGGYKECLEWLEKPVHCEDCQDRDYVQPSEKSLDLLQKGIDSFNLYESVVTKAGEKSIGAADIRKALEQGERDFEKVLNHGLGMEGRCNKCGARSCSGIHKENK